MTRISGIIFDASSFHVGWTYKITSKFEVIEKAVLLNKRNSSLQFGIKRDNENVYDVITISVELAGSNEYRFEHIVDEGLTNVCELPIAKG